MGRALVNANVLPMHPPDARAQAIAWEEDRILAVGDEDTVGAVAKEHGLDLEDAGGRVVLPGFVDAHMHFLHVGVRRTRPDLRFATSRDHALEITEEWIASHPGEGPVTGEGWDESSWEEQERPTRADLDRIAGDRPVVLRRICGHVAVANTAALATIRQQWDDERVETETGLLLEEPSLYLNEVLPAPDDVLDEAVDQACAVAHRLGVTALGDYEQAPLRDALLRAAGDGRLTVRVACSVYAPQLDEAIAAGFHTGRRAPGPDGPSPWMRDGGVKVFLDGSLGGHTALMLEPYDDRPQSRGRQIWSDAEVAQIFAKAHAHGIQIHAHAIGDGAIEQGLRGFEGLPDMDTPGERRRPDGRSAGKRVEAGGAAEGTADPTAPETADARAAGTAEPRARETADPGAGGTAGPPAMGGVAPDGAPLRHRFEHFEIAHDDQVRRTAALGVISSSQPNFVGAWSSAGGMYEDRIGRRFWLNNRFRTFDAMGLRVCFGSDGMPFGPLQGLHSAIHHPVEDERLSVLEALHRYTWESARALHWESEIGSLAPGKRADLLVFDQTRLDDRPKQWVVHETITGGVSRGGNQAPVPYDG